MGVAGFDSSELDQEKVHEADLEVTQTLGRGTAFEFV